MTFLRFTLHATAVLTGAYSLLTWTLGLLHNAGIAGAISAAAVVAAEAIRWCGRERERAADMAYHPSVWELPPDPFDIEDWAALLDTEAQEAARHTAMPRPVWPHEVGAPE